MWIQELIINAIAIIITGFIAYETMIKNFIMKLLAFMDYVDTSQIVLL